MLDKIMNFLPLLFDNKHSRWHTYSWLKFFFLRKYVLRSDYIQYTASRYSRNVQLSYNEGFIPADWNEFKYEFHLERLRDERSNLV